MIDCITLKGKEGENKKIEVECDHQWRQLPVSRCIVLSIVCLRPSQNWLFLYSFSTFHLNDSFWFAGGNVKQGKEVRDCFLSRAPASVPLHRKQYKVLDVLTVFLLEPKEHLVPGFLPPPSPQPPSPDNANPPCDDCLCARDPTKFTWTWGRCAAAHFSLPDAHLSPLIPQDASQWGKCEACFCDGFQGNASLVGTLAPSVWTFPGSSIRCPGTDIAVVTTHIPESF